MQSFVMRFSILQFLAISQIKPAASRGVRNIIIKFGIGMLKAIPSLKLRERRKKSGTISMGCDKLFFASHFVIKSKITRSQAAENQRIFLRKKDCTESLYIPSAKEKSR